MRLRRERLALALALVVAAPLPADGSDPPAGIRITVCRAAAVPAGGPDPFAVSLSPTAHANGATGVGRLRFAASPFGLSVTPDGHHRYELELATRGLPQRGGVRVVWVATPELDRVTKLGVLDGEGRVAGEVAYNKFLVFVTAEPSAAVERWSGPILLRGISRSGLMHTMAGHGPFSGERC